MSPPVIRAEIRPELLRWARETAGLEVNQVARRFNKLEKWERGVELPTIRQLEALSDVYKRPFAAFFLPSPPAEPPSPTDFRVLPGAQARTLSKKVHLAMRRGRRIQRLYAELGADLALARPSRVPRISSPADPEMHAVEFRQLIGISVSDQLSWPDAYDAFRAWRSAAETLGVLVLQLSMPVKEARGFSLSDGPMPTIVVNSSDAISARNFTLFHEVAHLLLNSSGLCIPDPAGLVEPNEQVEQFCNHFAGAFLVPLDALRSQHNLIDQPTAPDELDERMSSAARAFKVSRYVVLRRLLIAGFISDQQFRYTMDRWRASEAPTRAGGGGQRPATKTLSQLGLGFVSQVLEAHGRGLITSSAVADYLSVNLKYLPEVHKLVSARTRG